MAQQEPKQIVKRAEEAWKIKDRWKSIFEECYELALPAINPYAAEKKHPRHLNRQFDSTAPNAVIKLANRILMDLTPPHEDWIQVVAGPALKMQFKKSPKVLEQVNEKLEGVSEIINMMINLGEMVASRHSAFIDLVISGIGVLLDLEDPSDNINPVISQAVSQDEVAIEIDARGRRTGIFRKRKIKIGNIKGLWADAEIPADLTSAKIQKENPEIELVEATYYNTEERRQGSNQPVWYYEVFYVRSGKDPERIVERGYDENPWTIFQWMALPGCPYGPSPVMMALADIRTANKIVEMILKNAALALAGMYLVRDDGVVNPDNIVLSNGGFIPVGATGGPAGASIAPLETGRDFEIGQITLEDFRMQINKWLFNNSLPPLAGNVRSATEIIERVRELTQDIGGGIGRLTADLDNYVASKIRILIRAGIIPFDLAIDQFTLKIQINSPLARAQQLKKVETVIQWLQMVQSIGGPQLLLVVAKLPEIAAWIAEQMGVPTDLVNDEDEQEEIQKGMGQIIAAGAMPEQAQSQLSQAA